MENRGNPLPEHMVDQIRQMRRRGVSIRDIAEASGVAKSTVEKYCGGPLYAGDRAPAQPRLVHPVELDEVDEIDEQMVGEPADEYLAAVEGGYDPLLDEYLADE